MTMARRATAAQLLSAVLLSVVGGYGVPAAIAQATPTDTQSASPPAPNSEPAAGATASPSTQPLDPEPGVPAPAAETPATAPPANPEAAIPAAPTAPSQAATPPDTPASSTPAATDPAAAAAQAQAPPPPADPVIAAVREKFNDKASGKSSAADRQAAAAFYLARADGPLWVKPGGGFTPAADSAIGEIRKANDWGLEASAYKLPQASSDTTPQALADAEAAITLAVLQYARDARGGRIDPEALSPALDLTRPLKDPKAVIEEISKAGSADVYLRDLQPKHEQFVRLRQVLLKMRGSTEPAPVAAVDEAEQVKLPQGNVIKPGMKSPDVSLLRRRLKVMAEAGNEDVFDQPLQDAVIAFQKANGIKANGFVGKSTRAALNGDAAPAAAKPDKDRDVQRIINNMERWRWMPEKLGDLYVWNNIPEYTTRTMKDGKEIYREKIVVGMPQWTTPAFSARMRSIVFHPEWGVPDGIKLKELQPQLRRAGGNSFFEDLFSGGGGSGGSAVLRRHDLRVSYNGRQIDPDSVDWGSVDIRRYQFTQPSGPKNVLGIVKFLFPNKHDVYMHDTTQKELFARDMRAYSHGCMRVANPMRFAELLLKEDKGWSPTEVEARFNSGASEVQINKEVWVHNTYFTASVDDSGKLHTFADLYGFEPRIASALSGKQYRFETPPEVAEADPEDPTPGSGPPQRKGKKRGPQPDSLAEAISGLFAN